MGKKKILNIFIDESGDFGPYKAHSPNYYVAMVFHEQALSISESIATLDAHLSNIGYQNHTVHTGPIIRKELIYKNDLMENRKKIFNALFHFARKLPIHYICPKINKAERNALSKSELEFFHSARDFNKNLYKQLEKKKL